MSKLSIKEIIKTATKLKGTITETPFLECLTYSEKYHNKVFFKREDLQVVRSYKIRGAYNKILSLSPEEQNKGVICASAGNHAQGVAYSCNKLQIRGTIYMPATTPKQKIQQVTMFGGDLVEIKIMGNTFDDSYKLAQKECEQTKKIFVHPFDDEKIIEGQATVGLEIIEQKNIDIDYLFIPVGGGGLASGILSVFKELSPNTKVIGVEPVGAPSMTEAIKKGEVVELSKINKFVDGAAVQKVGKRNFEICKKHLHDMITVTEGLICQTILDLYNKEAMVVEPAGALSVAALKQMSDEIKGKNVACVISGSNNDITRMAEIKERALLYAKLKHYFIVNFPQRAGALREFVIDILGKDDDITYFEYHKKNSKENGPAVIGVELKRTQDLKPLIERMKEKNFLGEYLNQKPELMSFLL